MKTAAIRKKFNTLAASLGCKARIAGTAKKIELQEFLYVDSKGYEIVQKVNFEKFGVLISKYPELHFLD